jgi:MFS family permease
MGIGAAASEPGTLSLIRHIYPEREERAAQLGVWAAVSGLALALGPVVGVSWPTGPGWRSIFWFGFGFGALALAVAAVTLTESKDPDGRRLDVPRPGHGRRGDRRRDLRRHRRREPGLRDVVDRRPLRVRRTPHRGIRGDRAEVARPGAEDRVPPQPDLRRGHIVAFATNLAVFSIFFFTALYLQLITNFSGYQIALVFTSLAVAMIVSGPIAGYWTARIGPRLPMVLGCLLAGLGLLLVDRQLTATTSVSALTWPLAIAGLGFGIALVTMTQSVLTLVPPEQSGMAASTVNTSRELGGVFGVAVLGAVVNAQLTSGLTEKLVRLGIPVQFREIVVRFVTTGGNITDVENSPAVRGHGRIVARVLVAAENSAGHGVHLALQDRSRDRPRRGRRRRLRRTA